MAAYILARVNVTDRTKYMEYTKVTPGVVARFGGRFIVRGGETVTLEGPEEAGRIVIIEFPSMQKAKEFYNSDEYSRAKKLRFGAASAQILAIDGCTS